MKFLKAFFPHILLTIYIVLFVSLGINPYARDVWYVENGPIFGIALLLVIGWFRGIRFSNTAYACMSVLLYMHTIGGHYTFERVPFDWFNDFFGFERNMYDRVAHFTVGFYAFPFAEYLLTRKVVNKKWVAYALPLFFIMALAAAYELFEWWYAVTYGGDAGAAFLGSQGDIWDAQKDMLMDTLGAVASLTLFALISFFKTSKKSPHRRLVVLFLVYCIVFSLLVIGRQSKNNENQKLSTSSQSSKTIKKHTNHNCEQDSTKEYVYSEKENYQVVVLCAGYVIPTDSTIAIELDQVFLKDIKSGTYYAVTYYESAIRNTYQIIAVAYPDIFLHSCYEGCGAPTMVELNQGPNDPSRFFDIADLFYRNGVESYLERVNGKIIVAGGKKIAEFDPKTFNIKKLYEVKEGEALGFSSELPSFISSLKKVDDKHIEFKVYSQDAVYSSDENGKTIVPKENYTKLFEIK